MVVMNRLLSNELHMYVGDKVRVRGWLHALRSLGKIHFLIVRDRAGLIQVVIQDPVEFKKIRALQVGSVLEIHAEVSSNPEAHMLIELLDPSIKIEVAVTDVPEVEYVKAEIPSEIDYILDHRAISLRNRKIQAVFNLQAEIAHAYRKYMHDCVGAVEYFSPNIIGASSEGGAEFFNVDYFGYSATLAQSSQLYKQVMVGVNERVFALAPFFRAEKSHTSRHLSEGKQFEFEMGFFEHWHDLMDIQESAIKSIVAHLNENCSNEIGLLEHGIIKAPQDVAFPRFTFEQAQTIYFERTGVDERHEDDLSPAAEKELCEYVSEKYGTDLVFITDWKTSKRPFYSSPNEHNPELTNTFDLLCAGTEITSGGQRRHTYASMIEGIQLKGMEPADFKDYLSIFKYGMPEHGGFGMGLERLTMTMLKLSNIREASLFPSDPKRIAGTKIKAKIFFGAENIRNEILRLLKENNMQYMHLQNNIDAAPTIKAMLLRGKKTKKNYQFNLLTNQKLDMKRVSEIVQEKCEFEDPNVLQTRFGLVLGGVPPLGHLLNIDTYYDEKIQNTEKVYINCGVLHESIELAVSDLLILAEPKIVNFAIEQTI